MILCVAALAVACEMAIPPFGPIDRPDNGELPPPVEAPDTVGWNIPAEAITVAQAREICMGLESGANTGTKYYVMGYVKKLHNNHASGITGYGNAQFYIEDVKGANSGDDFMAFQVYGPNSKKLTDPNEVAVGDFVVIYGALTNYNGTFETVGKGAAYIWKSTNPLLNAPQEPAEPEILVIPEEAKAWNIPAEAIDVIKAREICAALAAGAKTDTKYYVMGYVKKLHNNHESGITGFGNAQFFMENVKGANSQNDFIAFQVYGINGEKITSLDQVVVGEEDGVSVFGAKASFPTLAFTNSVGAKVECTIPKCGIISIFHCPSENILFGGLNTLCFEDTSQCVPCAGCFVIKVKLRRKPIIFNEKAEGRLHCCGHANETMIFFVNSDYLHSYFLLSYFLYILYHRFLKKANYCRL